MRSSTHHLNSGHHKRAVRAQMATSVANVKSYREAIEDLIAELAAHAEPLNLAKAERVLLDRVDQPELSAVLSATPNGVAGAVTTLLFELRRFHPDATDFAGDITDLVRIFLRSQIDAMWWGTTRPFQTDAELTASPDLIDLEQLRHNSKLRFRYRRQPANMTGRVIRAAERRLWPDRTPRTAGVRFCHTRPEAVALLNQVSTELARGRPGRHPAAMGHQHGPQRRAPAPLAVLGYPRCCQARTASATRWMWRWPGSGDFGAHRALAWLLLERQDSGDANIIDEGQVWHICVNPAAAQRLRSEFDADAGV